VFTLCDCFWFRAVRSSRPIPATLF
jgi:hypothetical protein